MDVLFYRLNRYHFSDLPLSRWIQISLLLLTAFAALGIFPGGTRAAFVPGLIFVGFTAASVYWRVRSYVTFNQKETPEIQPQPLDPDEKIPVSVTGFFEVEGKHRQFTWLEGYFRTFATREHALLCLVQPSRFALIGAWPEKDVGMWYIFFKENEIEQVRWGKLIHGDKRMACVAVDHRIFIPKQGRFDRDKTLHKTAYIACEDVGDAHTIFADLLHDEAGELPQAVSHNGNGRLPVNQQAWRRINGRVDN